jgi:hypothetical protein
VVVLRGHADVLCGGICWFPAAEISRARDPMLTALLAAGLGARKATFEANPEKHTYCK